MEVLRSSDDEPGRGLDRDNISGAAWAKNEELFNFASTLEPEA